MYHGINRIRSYRNNYLHLELNVLALEHYNFYLGLDLDGQDAASVSDGFFIVQSAILNGLLISIKAEMALYD